eukprot:Amastigsp_a185619_7.p5 type:complete len:110 gc:universal Amastigsp_a185619_7:608-937(+)
MERNVVDHDRALGPPPHHKPFREREREERAAAEKRPHLEPPVNLRPDNLAVPREQRCEPFEQVHEDLVRVRLAADSSVCNRLCSRSRGREAACRLVVGRELGGNEPLER